MAAGSGLEWTFDSEAERYERMRPGYITELYEDIWKYVFIDRSSSVVEIGIGAGQATLPVLMKGCKVTAVECGDNLAKLCRHKFREFPEFSVVTAKFEDFECEKNSCDLVYCASAFHWIPEETGYSKVCEILRSGGAFARFANHPYIGKGGGGLGEAIQKLYSVYMPGSSSPAVYREEDAKRLAETAQKYGFTDISYQLYHRTRSFTAKEYTSLLGTYSDHIAIEKQTRRKFFSKIEKAINQAGGQITIYDTIDLELARKP